MRNYRRKTTTKYSQEVLKKAIDDVKNGKFNSYQASRFYDIPRTTIVDRITGRRGAIKETRGRPTAIDIENEQRLAAGLRTMEKHGFGLSCKETTVLVSKYVKGKNLQTCFKDGKPGYDWMVSFRKRNNLSLKKPQAVEMSRKAACDPFIIREYFETLEDCFNKLDLYMHPEKIWNLDESSFSMDPDKTKVLGARGVASTRTIASTGKDNITVLFTVNAVGEKLPPLIVFRGKNVWDQWMSPNAFQGTTYAATKNGWMESDVFEKYMLETVFPHVSKEPPALIIYDGHSTHIQLSIVEKAAELGITILKLPSHTSHLLQPLDLAVFKSLKDNWDSKILAWQRLNVGKKLPKNQFSQIIGAVWQELDPKIIRNGFNKGGAYPLNKNVVDNHKFDQDSLNRFQNHASKIINNVPSLSSLCLKVVSKEEKQMQTHKISKPPICVPGTSTGISDTRPLLLKPADICVPGTSTSISDTQPLLLKPADICVPGSSTGSSNIHIIDDRIVNNSGIESFESLLLATIKKADNSNLVNLKKRKVAKGCEVITRDYYINQIRKEAEIKKQKELEKKIKQLKKAGNTENKKKKQTNKKKKQARKNQHLSSDTSEDNEISDKENKVNQESRNIKKKLCSKKQINKNQKCSDESPKTSLLILSDDDSFQDWDTFRQNLVQSEIESGDSDHEMDQSKNHAQHTELNQYEPDVTRRQPKLNDWVLVKFTTKKTVKHFIGRVISVNVNRIPNIKFLRKNRNSKNQSFHYPDVDDISEIKHEEDIVKFLEEPQVTRRGQVVFTDDLKPFNIQ